MEDGVPTWPDKFPMEKIAQIRAATGEAMFASQMMLVPAGLRRGRFDPAGLEFYDEPLVCEERNRTLSFSIGSRNMHGCSCWWDPAYGGEGGDASVVCVVFVGIDGARYIHDIEYLKTSGAGGKGSAREQCTAVAAFVRRNFCPSVNVEVNGLGKFLPELLQEEFRLEGIRCAVVEQYSRKSKALRIAEAFETLLSAGLLRVGQRARNSPFMAEFSDWSSDSRGRDDGMDAAAGAISARPEPLPKTSIVPIRSRFAGRIFKVKKA
jgi:hypothetical protein